MAALILLGFMPFSGKPLTLHEGRLPQSAWEMLETGRWLIPFSGERPWLERPPFPHWMLMLSGMAFGGLDRVWVARLPGMLAATATLLLTMWSASRLFGRSIGLLAGVLAASMYEFNFYSGQAEDDIYLALIVSLAYAAFIADRFPLSRPDSALVPTARLDWYKRPAAVLLFFFAVGITSLAKGPGVGLIQVVGSCVSFVLLCWDTRTLRKYLWPPGLLLTAAVFLAWPAYAYCHHPDVLDNWRYDLNGPFGHEPFWYYPVQLLWVTQPWTVPLLLGLYLTYRAARCDCRSPERFLWCWILVPVLIASLSQRKHHHYLVPMLPATAVMAAIGLRAIGTVLLNRPFGPREFKLTLLLWGGLPTAGLLAAALLHKLPGPTPVTIGLALAWAAATLGFALALRRRSTTWMLGSILFGMASFYAYGQGVLAVRNESGRDDIRLVQQARDHVPAGEMVYVLADAQLDFFRLQYYLPRPNTVLQNATYLRDQRITRPVVYVVARVNQTRFIAEEVGQLEELDRSHHTRGERRADDRFVLYKLTFKPNLLRYPAPPVGVVQAMYRYDAAPPGPYCGPPPRSPASTQPAPRN